MPGKRFDPRSLAAPLAALMLFALPGCYPRKSISSAPTGAPATAPSAANPAAGPVTSTEAGAENPPEESVPQAQESDIAESAPAAQPTPAATAATPAAAPASGPAAPAAGKENADVYYVQIGAFSTEKNATGAVEWLKTKGYPQTRIVVMTGGPTTYHRVQAGPYPSYAAARQVLDKLRVDWPQAFIPGD